MFCQKDEANGEVEDTLGVSQLVGINASLLD